jgi:hypothetical protein
VNFAKARKIADAVLYEGYVLYPYRPSSAKNQFRWQFGIVAPRGWDGDPTEMQTECLIEAAGSPAVDITVRFLQVKPNESGWEEGIERSIDLHAVPLENLHDVSFDVPGDPPISGVVRLAAEPIDGFHKLCIGIENHTSLPDVTGLPRSAAMRRALVGTHILLGVSQGAFVSLIDPPHGAREAAHSCSNRNTWPVLVGNPGERDTMLSAPIILEDYPAIAPESPVDLCDGTEIDEILTLRVMTLTDEEKREACASDDRARRIIERCDEMPPEVLERLHGGIRSLGPAATEEFFNPADEKPEKAAVEVGGLRITRGARVRLTPKRRADAMDLFLAGRIAVVESVHHDVEDRVYVAVTVEDDPAADLQGRVGRFFYFDPDELELAGKEP